MENTNPTQTGKKSKSKYWGNQSFGDQISLVAVIISASREYPAELNRRGIDETFLNRMDELLGEINEINNLQEHLKGELRKTTEKLDTRMIEIGNMYMELKKTVKIGIKKAEWKKFGFTDKK